MKAPVIGAVAWWLVFSVVPASAGEVPGETAAPATEAAEAEPISQSQYVREVRSLFATGKVEEADEKFHEALSHYPDSEMLKRFHITAYGALSAADRSGQAHQHLEAHVDYLISSASHRTEEMFARDLGVLADTVARHDGPQRTLEVLDDFSERARMLETPSDHVLRATTAQRAVQLAKAGQTAEARALLDEQFQATQSEFERESNDRLHVEQMANALKYRCQLEQAIQGGDEQSAWAELLDFLDQQARAHPESQPVVSRFLNEHLQRAAALARNAPDEAEALVDRVTSFRENEGAEAEIHAFYDRQIAQLRQTIERTRRMLAVIGSPALYPENVDSWANGDELTPESLRGQVVVLDFFAVWCGPCIATFPHLRQWHEDYADHGLQIIGVSRYYKYGWDEQSQRPQRENEIEPSEERAAMEQFLAHHELRHPVAFVTEGALQDFYAVSGIPHIVVIDRHGIVRLMRVGSGQQNAHDVEEAIKQCLAE